MQILFRSDQGWLVPESERPKTQDAAPRGPSLPRRATNYAKALAAHAAAGSPKVSPEVLAERRTICASNRCGLLVAGVCQHIDCGCPVTRAGMFGDKLSWANEGCPHDPPLWGPTV